MPLLLHSDRRVSGSDMERQGNKSTQGAPMPSFTVSDISRFSTAVMLSAVLFLTGCATSSSERSKDAELHYQMGISYLSQGQVQAAYVQLQKALQLAPSNKDILNSIGLVHLQLEEYDRAVEFFQRAVSLDPAFSEGYNNLGVAFMKLRRWEDAKTAFRKAIANPLYQTPEMAYYSLGMSHYRTAQYDEAIVSFKNALRRAPTFPLPYYGLSLALNRQGRYGDAGLAFGRALEADPVFKGDRKRFAEDMKQRVLSLEPEEEADLKDYLDIMKY